jgi:predicted MFS family arabinose efflux permease
LSEIPIIPTEGEVIERAERPLAAILAPLTLARLVLNGLRRFPYAVTTPMAAALGVPRASLEQLLSFQFLIGLFSPFVGSVIERGRKRVMLTMIAFMTIGAIIAAAGQTFAAVAVAILLGSIAKTLYDPAMQAYLGEHVPFARRGFAIGVSELAWSGALVTIVALSAFLIVSSGLASIFILLAVLGALSWVMLFFLLPPDHGVIQKTAHERPDLRSAFGLIFRNRAAVVILLGGFLIAVGFDQFLIIYEVILLDKLKLTTQTIGALSWAFGLAEFGGEMVIVLLADRFGKRRLAILAPLALAIVFFVLRVAIGISPLVGVMTLFVMFFAFEITTISLTPLATEVVPAVRGIMMTLYVSAISLGRGVGNLIGGGIYRAAGADANLTLASVFFLAVAALIFFVYRERISARA